MISPVTALSSRCTVIALFLAASCGGDPADTGACPPQIESVRDCVESSVRTVAPDHPLPRQDAVPVNLYIDQSGSMNGYLDTGNADSVLTAHTRGANLRIALTKLLAVGSEQTTVYGFGDSTTSLPAWTKTEVLGRLFSQGFYDHRNTRTEEVLDSVRADSGRASVHLIVTDGRRGSGESAIAQYQRMGEVASWWTAENGIFAIGASMAPFRQEGTDSTGCRLGTSEAGRCPLYVFAFIPLPAAERTLSILDEVSQRLYAYPPPADTLVRMEHATASREGSGAVGVVRPRPFVLGFRARGAQNQRANAQVNLTFNVAKSAARFALDDSLAWQLERAVLRREQPEWTETGDIADDWVQPGTLRRGSGSTIVLPLTVRGYVGLPPTLYRIQISSLGRPRWVREYEAVQQRDSLRTYGIGTLFTQLQPRPALLAGAYVTVY